LAVMAALLLTVETVTALQLNVGKNTAEGVARTGVVFKGLGFETSGHGLDLSQRDLDEVYIKRWRELQPDHLLLKTGVAVDTERAKAFLKAVPARTEIWVRSADDAAVLKKEEIPCRVKTDVDLENGHVFVDAGTDAESGLRLAEEIISAITSGVSSVTIRNLDGQGGLFNPEPPDFAPCDAYYAAGLLSELTVGPADVLTIDCEAPELPIAAVENADGSTTILAVNRGDAAIRVNLFAYTHKDNYRTYTYGMDRVPTNAFADLPACANSNTGFSKRGGVGLVFAGKALTICRTEADTEPPEMVRFVDVSDAEGGGKLLKWDPIVEHDTSFYRIYRMNMPKYRFATKEQIGSTAGTTFVDRTSPEGKTVYYAVIAVDAYGNTSE
jgi:hypothetical protein